MRYFRSLWRKIKRLFSHKDSSRPADPIVEHPVDPIVPIEEGEIDTVDNGSWKEPDWTYLFDNATLDENRIDEIKHVCDKIYKNKERYEKVAKDVNPKMPWWFVAVLHYRESSLSFAGVLHNGDRIIGTGRKTYHVPKGRGPFDTWEEAAVDALQGFAHHKDWDVYNCLKKAERFNGLGYRRRGVGEYSPYVWAGTSIHDETGKYVADGRYSNTAVEKQLGVAAIIIGLRDYYAVKM